MITLTQLNELLGWAALLNISILVLATLLLSVMRTTIISIHSKMFNISENELSIIYFKYLANYKILTTVFILVPYIALKIMGQ